MARKPLYPHVPKTKVERLPQTDGNGFGLTRERITQTIISNLVEAGILLPDETDRYRRVLEGYDDMTLLRVLVHSHELKEARYA